MKRDSCFITKCYKSLLQNVTSDFITKCDVYYKMRQGKHLFPWQMMANAQKQLLSYHFMNKLATYKISKYLANKFKN